MTTDVTVQPAEKPEDEVKPEGEFLQVESLYLITGVQLRDREAIPTVTILDPKLTMPGTKRI